MQSAALQTQTDLARHSESQLVDLARIGEEHAVRALIKRNNQRLFRMARAVVRDDSEAEDVVQETYVKAFEKLDSFRGDSTFSTWISRIALNEAMGRVRQKRPTADLSVLDTLTATQGGSVIMFPSSGTPADAAADLARREIRKVLEQAIDDLPGDFRLVFMLRDIEDLSTEDVASELDLKPETVKTRLHRARRLLRRALEQRLSLSFHELFPFDGWRCQRLADRVVARLKITGPR